MTSGQEDIEYICEIIYNYSPYMLYVDVYDQFIADFRWSGRWNDKVAVLDKWLWKYQHYTVQEFMDLMNDPDYEPSDEEY